ncbi:hypothetical protein KKF91_10725 [Myxococcota bacterium]|nr:hypothetical protein [Myxococcota bacterium]
MSELKTDMIVNYNPEINIVKDVEPEQPTFDSSYRILRVRFWNAKTDIGNKTDVSLDDIETGVSAINALFSQYCSPYGYNIAVELASIGTYTASERCFSDKMGVPTVRRSYQIQPEDCWLFYSDAGNQINISRGDQNYLHIFFIHAFFQNGLNTIGGFVNENGGNTIVADTLSGSNKMFLTVAHELGHILGGCASDDDNGCLGGHINHNDDRCSQPSDNNYFQNHLMCDWNSGITLDKMTCAYYYDVLGPGNSQIPSRFHWWGAPGPWNFSEECDGIDNDMDGEIDENCN